LKTVTSRDVHRAAGPHLAELAQQDQAEALVEAADELFRALDAEEERHASR